MPVESPSDGLLLQVGLCAGLSDPMKILLNGWLRNGRTSDSKLSSKAKTTKVNG